MPAQELLEQDWDRAEERARQATARRPDLGWPHAILGWASQRRGDLENACKHYVAGLQTLGSSDDFVDPFGDKFGTRFAVCRLRELRKLLPEQTARTEHLRIAIRDHEPGDFPSRFRHFWLKQAEAAERLRSPGVAYKYYFNAGWDEFVANDMDQVLEGLMRTAEAAGWPGLHRIAKLHYTTYQRL